MKNTDTTSTRSPSATGPTFLTPAELASRWKITPMTLRRWRNSGKIRAHHLGRGIRFAMSDVIRIEEDSRA